MSIRFLRWDLITNSKDTPVLRLQAGDVLMTDPGGVDCFDTVLAAAEAAWRLAGEPPATGSWLDAAQAAMEEAPRGTLTAADTPRIVTSQAMAHERIKWLEDDDGLTTATGEWMLRGPAGRESMVPVGEDTELAEASEADLSGTQTAEWGLLERAIEAAGAPTPGAKKPVALRPPDDAPPPSESLAGKRTAEWAFASAAGSVDTEHNIETVEE